MSDRRTGECEGAHHAALQEISRSLVQVAERLRHRAAASREFIRLTERAQGIATQARLVSTSKWGVVENAAALARDLRTFAGEVAAASERASLETSGNSAVANALAAQAERLRGIGCTGVSAGPLSIRAELEPLEATLTTLRDRMRGGDTVAKDADVLARRATALADSAAKLSCGGRAVEVAALEIQRSLFAFVDDAVSISTRMSDASTGLSDAAATIARGATEVLEAGGAAPMTRPWQEGVVVWGR